jgi:hypothetical protein
VIASALSVALFLAPVSFHRMVYRQGLRDRLLVGADRLARAGLVSLILAVCGGVLLALDVILPRGLAIAIAAVLLLLFVLLWFILPAYVRLIS